MSSMSRKRSYEESAAFPGEASVHRSHPTSPALSEDRSSVKESASAVAGEQDGDWQLVEGRTKKKRGKRKKNKSMNKLPSNSDESVQPSVASSRALSTYDTSNRPSVICAAPHTLNSSLRISDLQQLVLYCLADGVGPQWISVRHRTQIRKAVVLMVPGLEKAMFTGSIDLSEKIDSALGATPSVQSSIDDPSDRSRVAKQYTAARSPDDYLPSHLDIASLPLCLKRFAEVFPQLYPIKAPGDDRRVHSPVSAILNTPLTKSAEEKQADKTIKGPKPAKVARDFVDVPTPITAFISSADDLIENEYVLHSSSCQDETNKILNDQRRKSQNATPENGWKEAKIAEVDVNALVTPEEGLRSLDAARKIYAIDCEMCKVEGRDLETHEYALARISIVDWNGSTVMDQLVKPDKPIVDYVTAFSGITKEKLDPIKTTLADVQTELLDLFTPDSILIGHSLNSDLTAMKITHPFVVDTSIIYPHPKGPPFKSSLKWLTQKYLNREIQKTDGNLGHDSIEDARAALDLVKSKCRHGPRWGTPEASGEDIFKRLARTPRPGSNSSTPVDPSLRDCRTGAVIDHGRPERTLGKNAQITIACSTDDEVAAGIKRAANGDKDGSLVSGGGVDFIFARMRELEALRGWSTDASANLQTAGNINNTAEGPLSQSHRNALTKCVGKLADRIADVYSSLPKCTLFIVYTGVGDPREMKRLSDMLRQYRREFAVKKWDELSVRWTDDEEQALKRAVRQARSGIGFVTVT